MSIKIYIKRIGNHGCKLPEIIYKGDWIDLRCAQETQFTAPQSNTIKYKQTNNKKQGYYTVAFDYKAIPLGFAMKLPAGYEAIVAPRSSTFKGMGLIQSNSIGIIDNSYCGNNDQWHFTAIALRDTTIKVGERICQFRIQLKHNATMWQKIKWLFNSKIEFIEVDNLNDENRGGLGEGTKNME